MTIAERVRSRSSLADVADAMAALAATWPMIADECRATLGGEQHYRGVIYHCLRACGVPRDQIGLNVKMWVEAPVTPVLQAWDLRKHEAFRGGYEPVPDLVIFGPDIAGDWRRRNRAATLRHMLLAIEIKASEREKGRLGVAEINRDLERLAAHRDEVHHRDGAMHPVMMIIDTVPLPHERMQQAAIDAVLECAERLGVTLLYLSADSEQGVLKA